MYPRSCAINCGSKKREDRVRPCCQGAYSMIMILAEATNGDKITTDHKSGHHKNKILGGGVF